MPFDNPITAGNLLVQPAIQSPNFVHLVQGWQVLENGNAEFNNVVLTGSFSGTDFIVNSAGAFFYSGAPASGNLIASIASFSGTDSFGNAYLQGITDYSTQFVELNQGSIFFGIAGSTLVQQPLIQTDVNGENISIESGQGLSAVTPAQIVLNSNEASSQAGLISLFGSGVLASVTTSGGESAFQIENTTSNPSLANLIVTSASAGDRAVALDVSGDSKDRFQIDSNGKMQWGAGGSSVVDTDFFRASAGNLQTDNSLTVGTNLTVDGTSTLDGVVYSADASGYPTMTDGAGFTANLSVGQKAAVNVNTVTQSTFTNLSVAAITANDAEVGAVYKLTLFGYGIWGSTQQELDLVCRFGAVPGSATDTVGTRAKIASTAFSASADFQWHAEVVAVCVTTGVSGTWQLSLSGEIDETTNPLNPGAVGDQAIAFAVGTGNTPQTQDTTSAINLGMSAQWASTTGAPTISKTIGFFERIS